MSKPDIQPPEYMREFAKRWIPSILEAALDLNRASHQYKYNQDPHIEAILESIAKLRMEQFCIQLRQFVFEWGIVVGVEADADDVTQERIDDGMDDASQPETDDAPPTSLAPANGETVMATVEMTDDTLVGLS